jgi:hypothetical protein
MDFLEQIQTVLVAARSHLELNKKLTLFEYLYNYRDKGLFVHYSDIEKVGINPALNYLSMSSIGIYAYPLDFILYYLKNEIEDKLFGNYSDSIVVFASDSYNLNVLKQKDVPNMEFLNITDGFYDNYIRDVKLLINFYNTLGNTDKELERKIIPLGLSTLDKFDKDDNSRKQFKDIANKDTHRDYTFKGVLKLASNIARYCMKKNKFGINLHYILTKVLHYSGLFDSQYTGATMHNDIPFEAVFLIPQSYEVIEQYRNKESIVNLYKDEDKKAQLKKLLDSLDDSFWFPNAL